MITGLGPATTDHDARLQEQVEFLRVQQEARRIVEAEEQPAVDLDALYLDRDALDHLPQPDPLIPAVLPRHCYGVLRGRDQSFKSFVALDWALTLASGGFWNMTPVERVPVLYIAGEGAWGLRARVAAWEERHGARVDPTWFTVRQTALNLHRPGPAFPHLLDRVRDRGYGLVVVDTLRRVSGAADGNGSEMGAVIDSLDQIKHATAGGTVLVVAHTDKSDTDSRGYSGIEDDADFVWHAKREEHRLELELTKMKDGPDGITVHLRAWPVGESLVLSPDAKPEPTNVVTESEAKLLATLQSFPDGAYSGALQAASGLPKATYHRALNALQRRGKAVNKGSHGRPFYEAASLTGPARSHLPESPSDLQRSHEVSPSSHEVSQVSRPLGSETPETSQRDQPDLAGFSDEQRAIVERLLAGDAISTPGKDES